MSYLTCIEPVTSQLGSMPKEFVLVWFEGNQLIALHYGSTVISMVCVTSKRECTVVSGRWNGMYTTVTDSCVLTSMVRSSTSVEKPHIISPHDNILA